MYAFVCYETCFARSLPVRRLSEYLVRLYAESHCKALLLLFRRVVLTLAFDIDSFTDTLEDVGDVRRLRDFRQLGRERPARQDWAYRHYVANEAVNANRAITGAVALRLEDADPSSARQWESDFMQAYAMKAASCVRGRLWAVTSDGLRIGDPPEETNLYLAWNAESKTSAVWPPMVPNVFD